ncbi:hypothetical protein B0H19DRAFT_1188702 [Mycena capillaripes]|nr:hypothetical protein B0H19DRAFT_1188702 [Mycena capillaripes]
MSPSVSLEDERAFPLFLLPLLDAALDLSPPEDLSLGEPNVPEQSAPHLTTFRITGVGFVDGDLSFCTPEPLLPSSQQLKARGIVHCDLDPRNLVRMPTHHLGIVDFGDVDLV